MPRSHEKSLKIGISGNGSQRDVIVCAHETGFSREIEWLKIIDFSQTIYNHVRQRKYEKSDINFNSFERWFLDIQL